MDYNTPIVKTRTACGICGYGGLIDILDLPDLPLTGFFAGKKPKSLLKGVNQKLLWCPKCAQGQLLYQLDPSKLYDFEQYSFRTSESASAKEGTVFFLRFLKTIIGEKILDYGIDVGCNDLYLLNEAAPFIKRRLGIDPIWGQKLPANLPLGAGVLGKAIEDVDFNKDISSKPDVIFCRHTIEHIFDPAAAISKLMEFADEDTLFIFETPSFSTLIDRCRFDQVFHEHLQYFSPASFEYLVNKIGGEIVACTENYHNWGAMLIAFRKGRGKEGRFEFQFKEGDIKRKMLLFRKQMKNTAELLRELSETVIYGYGAALMLPVLGYHLNLDFSSFRGVLDDDIKKDGIYYANLPVRISHAGKVDSGALKNASVFITALDNVEPIMTKLLSVRARNIIYPFHLI